MVFYDWNGDGKKDLQDDFVEYNMYKGSTKQNANSLGNHNNNGKLSTFWRIVIAIGIVIIIAGVIELFEPKCAYSGCNNKPEKGSFYCWLHKASTYHYSGYKKYDNYQSTTRNIENTTLGHGNINEMTTKAAYTEPTTRKYTSEKQTTGRKNNKDIYNVYGYDDPEDFYEDNYDDFDSFEDAEDYYNDAWDE